MARVSRQHLFTLIKGWASSAVDEWSCWCVSPDLLLSPNSPPASTSVPIKPLIHLQVMTHQLLPELSAVTVTVVLLWEASLCLECFSWDSCLAAVLICLMSWVFICVKYSRDDLYSESVCERWDALLMEEASVWCVNGCSSTTHTFMSQGLIWLTDLHSFWSFCYMKVTLKLFRKLLAIPSSLNDATFQMPLRKFSYQC